MNANSTRRAPTPEEMFRRVMLARPAVYRLGGRTPTDGAPLPGGGRVLLKREDLGPVHSFKWRGAAVKIDELHDSGCVQIVAASAGNHAQGVAMASAALGVRATIFMPRTTPRIKRSAVERFGGPLVEVRLEGDRYDDSAEAATTFAEVTGATIVHPYDDPSVIAGQGVIGDEIVQDAIEFERIYLPIGGGGLAAGVGCVIRAHLPGVEIVGVEAEGQASMSAALKHGAPVDIGRVDAFCDGTAVRRAGETTFALCRDVLDRVVTVSVDEVCGAVEHTWEAVRAVPEPAGALGVAAAIREGSDGATALTVLSGANLDFMMLPRIAQRAHVGRKKRRYYAFSIDERAGSLVALLDQLGDGCNIVDFQYGKTDDVEAEPVIGFEGSPAELGGIPERAAAVDVAARDVTGQQAVGFRVIPLRPGLFRWPVFVTIGFPDRGGALREFMHRVGDVASICYFNFASSGENEGRAMMGFELDAPQRREEFLRMLGVSGLAHEVMGPDECRFRAAMDSRPVAVMTGAQR